MTESDSIVEDIYEAAIRPHQWGNVLDKIRTAVEAKHAVISMHDAKDSSCNRVMTAGATPDLERIYLKEYIDSDVLWLRKVFCSIPEGHVIGSQDFQKITGLTRQSLMARHTVFFDLAGLHSHAFSLPIHTQSQLSAFSVHRTNTDDFFEAPQIQLLGLLSSHLRRALRIHYHVNIQKTNLSQALYSRCNASKGLVFLDHHLKFLSANSEGLRILENGKFIYLNQDKRIKTVKSEDHDRLQALFAHISQGRIDTAKPLAIGGSALQHPLKVLAIPVQYGEVEIALLLTDFSKKIAISSEYLHDAYQLTSTELDVASLLVNGSQIKDIARIRNTSESTARWQLKCLLHKTHSKSQADLIRLLIAIAD